MYTPGDENDLNYVAPANENDGIIKDEETTSLQNEQQNAEATKPLGEKIHEALQDWSNKDQADQDFDDTRP